jgi:DNA-binding GntR family transcriptional regulator
MNDNSGSPHLEGLPTLSRESLAMSAYREIRKRLTAGLLAPGQSLTLRELSESLGVSQTPVREALMQLVSEKALVLVPGRSVRVPQLSIEELAELRTIRCQLECFAAQVACEKVTPELIAELTAIHRELAEAKRAKRQQEVLRHNMAFHFRLMAGAEMPNLQAMIESLWVRTAPYLRYLYQGPRSAPSDKEHPHLAIIGALRRKDQKGVVSALRRDIEASGEVLLANLAAGAASSQQHAAV